jgi:hypothetical protein
MINFFVIDTGFGNDDVVECGLVGQVGVGFVEQGVTGGQVRRFRWVFEDTRVTAVLHFFRFAL